MCVCVCETIYKKKKKISYVIFHNYLKTRTCIFIHYLLFILHVKMNQI